MKKICAVESGGFVISGTAMNDTTKGWDIKAAIFDEQGNKVKSEFDVNEHTFSTQQKSDIASLPDGGFIATWYSYDGADGSGASIKARIFNERGNVIVDEFLVNQAAEGLQSYPSVAVRADGSFVVVWFTQATGYGLSGRIFNADGSPATDEFNVNGDGTVWGAEPSITWLPNGQIVVVWSERQSEFSGVVDLKASVLNNDGTVAIEEFTVANGASAVSGVVALGDSQFIITWTAADGGTPINSVVSLLYGTPGGGEELPYTSEDSPVQIDIATLIENDTDAEGDVFIFSLDTGTSAHGATVTYDADTGTLTYDSTLAEEIQALNSGQALEDTFTYSVSDGNGGTDQATVTIVVGGADEDDTSAFAQALALPVTDDIWG